MIDVTSTSPTDRPPVTNSIKTAINNAFLIVPEGKKSALLGIYDFDSGDTRIHFAWKANEVWKVGAQVGWAKGERIEGYVGVEAAW